MKTIFIEGGLTLTIETPRVPLLALDTNVLIEAGLGLAKPGSGDDRVMDLFDRAMEKVDEGRLLCFETNQREEYLGSRDSAQISKASLPFHGKGQLRSAALGTKDVSTRPRISFAKLTSDA